MTTFSNLAFRKMGQLTLVAALAAGSALPIAAQELDLAKEIETIREATARFADVNVALAEGYIPDPDDICVSGEEGLPAGSGDMGIHYLRSDLLDMPGAEPPEGGNGQHTDFAAPPILLYEPQADGSMVLVGVEFGSQHVWLRENPTGNLMPFNPAVTCEHHVHSTSH